MSGPLCRLFHKLSLLNVFFVGLWVIWHARNRCLLKHKEFNPFFSAQWRIQMITDYQRFHLQVRRDMTRVRTRWECPPSGRFKLNVDGDFVKQMGIDGLGIIEVSSVLSDGRHILKGFNLVQLRYIGREANGVADKLACLARLRFHNHVWVGGTPDTIQDILQADFDFLPDVIRGSSSTYPRSML